MFQNCSGLEENLDNREGITFFHRKRFLSRCRKISLGNLVLLKFSGIKKVFLDNWVISRLPVKNFLSHSVGNILRGTLLCFEKFLVSKKFLHRRR